MNYAVVTAKIDPLTKKAAMKTASEIGMPLSVIIKAFLKQFIRTRSVAFSAQSELPSKYLRSVIRTAEKNLKTGRHSPVFQTGEDAVSYLNKQGI